MRTVLSAVLVAGTLIFAAGAHADRRDDNNGHRSQNSERHDGNWGRDHSRGNYSRDNYRHYDNRNNHGRDYNSRWGYRSGYRDGYRNNGGYRYYAPGYRSYSPPPRYYWRQNSSWYYGSVPRGYRGTYYSSRPRDSYGQVIISIPLF